MGVNGEGWVWRRIRNCSGWHRVVWKLWHEYGESRVGEEGLELGWRAYSGCKVPRNSVEAKDGYGEPDMVLFWCIGPLIGSPGFSIRNWDSTNCEVVLHTLKNTLMKTFFGSKVFPKWSKYFAKIPTTKAFNTNADPPPTPKAPNTHLRSYTPKQNHFRLSIPILGLHTIPWSFTPTIGPPSSPRLSSPTPDPPYSF